VVPPSPNEAALLTDASRALEMDGVTLLISDAVKAPALYGAFRPRILFPPGFVAQLAPEELRLTLAHELAHVRRRDLFVDSMLHLAVVVHWFNPLAWIAARLARQDCEVACD
jgi:bla regulator protein BlaR1